MKKGIKGKKKKNNTQIFEEHTEGTDSMSFILVVINLQ